MTRKRTAVRGIALATPLAAGVLVLTACGDTAGQDTTMMSGSAPTATATTATARPEADFNEADVMFAQMMTTHHQEAIEMADAARTRASSKEVKKLAANMSATRQAEVQTMKGWLSAWGEPMPAADAAHVTSGGSSDGDVKTLLAVKGPAFDKEFLTLMIAHHKEAMTMARAELDHGKNPQAKELAEKMEKAQEAEMEQMEKLLYKLP
ncbi:DUF305 domain-containing protein [Nonomuraea sp. NPDC046802]|uniref:DUF305 domain-containing protein n=1 Tax=Nonomuraea sp. NPDC046802 TaxID=3154919 RepID=UPI0033D6900D